MTSEDSKNGNAQAGSPPPSGSADWPKGLSVTVGSRWQTKERPRLQGELFAADVALNTVALKLEETEDFRGLGALAGRLVWESSAQHLMDKWECMPNSRD